MSIHQTIEAVPDCRQQKPRLTNSRLTDSQAVRRRWAVLQAARGIETRLCDEAFLASSEVFRNSIENLIGWVKLPLGLVGPLRIHGAAGTVERFIPLATTEGALVASYARGAAAITAAGGCRAVAGENRVQRAPGFAFPGLVEAQAFCRWIAAEAELLRPLAEAGSRHTRLLAAEPRLEGNHVYLLLTYATGDAAGQNMATFATEALVAGILEATPVRPGYCFLEANHSGDKKASAFALVQGRGRRACAEVTLPAALVRRQLRVSVRQMLDYWRMSAIGGVLTGTLGIQGHYANGLAALFIATGQDAACVAESALGVTRMEEIAGGGLYASVTLPSLLVGSVGGGTGLPWQRAALELMDLQGDGKAGALAETAAALCLAGEISIIAALAAGHFAQAHRKCARG